MVRTVSPAEYLDVPRPQMQWLVTGLIPRPAYLLLLGAPKAGKSFLAWDIASAVAQGKPLMGYACPSPQKVVYIQLDTKEMAWTERLKTFRDTGIDLNIPNLRLVHQDDQLLPCIITQPQGKAFIRELMVQEDPALVILDVLREAHTEDENDSTVMKQVFDAMEPLFAGRTVILVHHTRKLAETDSKHYDPVSLARGSSYITGRVDGFWLLYGDAPLRKLKFESRFQEPTITTAKQDANSGLFSFPDLAPDQALYDALASFCALHPKSSHAQLLKEACQKFGISRSTYYRVMPQVPCVHAPSSPGPHATLPPPGPPSGTPPQACPSPPESV